LTEKRTTECSQRGISRSSSRTLLAREHTTHKVTEMRNSCELQMSAHIYPVSFHRSWTHLRGVAALSYGSSSSSTTQEWSNLRPLINLTPTNVKNKGGGLEANHERVNG
jgi:hypothetical protein